MQPSLALGPFFLALVSPGTGLFLPGLQAQEEPTPAMALRLMVVTSKPRYDELEPIILRAYLVNPGREPAVLLKPEIGFLGMPGLKHLGWGGLHLSAFAWIRLEEQGRPLGEDGLVAFDSMEVSDPALPPRPKNEVYISGGGGRIREPYWGNSQSHYFVVPPGERLFVCEDACLLGLLDNSNDSSGRLRRHLKPGTYVIRAAFIAKKPKLPWSVREDLDPSVQPLHDAAIAVDLRSAPTFEVIPCRQEVRERWEACRAIRFGMPRRKIEAILGPPAIESACTFNLILEGGPAVRSTGVRASYLLGTPATEPSVHPWGRLHPLYFNVEYELDGRTVKAGGELGFPRAFPFR